MKHLLNLILLGLFLAGCASTKKQEQMNDFRRHLDDQSKWDESCQKGVQVACALKGTQYSWSPNLAIMQGATDDSSTQIVILHSKKKDIVPLLWDADTKTLKKTSLKKMESRSHSSEAVTQANFQNLDPKKTYKLLVADQYGKLVDQREVKTLVTKGKNLKWAVASCMNDKYMMAQKQQWRDLVAHKPEVIFLIGDNVYVDLDIKFKRLTTDITPELIWDRYVVTRDRLELFRQKVLTPVFATWDDHDYGANNAGREFVHKGEAKKVFNLFFPRGPNKVVVSKGPGVARAVVMRGQIFMFLDDRTFRSKPKATKDQAHFGEEQEKWMLDVVKKHKGPVWLISGDQWWGGYHPYESYQGNHPDAFKKFLTKLRQSKRRFVFMSGDRHLTEIMKIPVKDLGYQSYEITSSGVHSTVFPGSFKRTPNPIAIEAVDGTMNYMVLTSQPKGSGVDITSVSYGPDNRVLFKRKLKVR